MDITKISFNWSTSHNPNFNIVSFQYNDDMSMTYCIPVDRSKICETFEVYVGSNYNRCSDKRSYSRSYVVVDGNFNSVPKRWAYLAKQLKEYLIESLSKLKEAGIDDEVVSTLDKVGLSEIWKNELK